MINKNSSIKGQSLFELVVALAVTAIIIVALVALVSSSIRNASYSKNNSLAAGYAQEATEWLRGQRDTSITTFLVYAQTPSWCLKSLSWGLQRGCLEDNNDEIAGTPFRRQVDFNITTVSLKTVIEVDVTVSWNDSQGLHEVKNVTNFSDWRQR